MRHRPRLGSIIVIGSFTVWDPEKKNSSQGEEKCGQKSFLMNYRQCSPLPPCFIIKLHPTRSLNKKALISDCRRHGVKDEETSENTATGSGARARARSSGSEVIDYRARVMTNGPGERVGTRCRALINSGGHTARFTSASVKSCHSPLVYLASILGELAEIKVRTG
ncbi:hypothetical protein ACOMHN_024793 [Nucella lapillus]